MSGIPTSRYTVPGLVRGLRILELFDRECPEWSLSELAKAAAVPRSTAYRLIVTLTELGYLENIEPRKTYRLGARVLDLGFEYLGSQDLVEIARAPLERLSAQTGGSTHLGVLDGTDVIYLLRVAGPSRLVSNVRVGTRLPAHATVLGRALLSDHSAEALRARFAGAPLAAATHRTAASIEALATQIREVQARGHALGVADFEAGISSVGAPVIGGAGGVVAAINFTGPEALFDRERLRTEVVGPVRETAAEISRRLGWNGPLPDKAGTSSGMR